MRVANSDLSLLVNDSIVQASDFIPRSEEVSNPDGSKPKRGSSLRLFIGWLIVFALLWRMQYIDRLNLESVAGAILMAVLGIGLLLRWPAKNIGITMASIVMLNIVFPIAMPLFIKRGKQDNAKVMNAKVVIGAPASALAAYKLDNGTFPATYQGLNALRVKPLGGPQSWNGP